jgi:hypothetical protein
MDNIGVIKDAHHLSNGIGLANVGKELIPQPFTLAGASNDAGDVDEGDSRRNDALAAKNASEHLEPVVGKIHHANVWLNGGEGVVRRQDRVFGERVKQSGLADIRESNDSNGESHG